MPVRECSEDGKPGYQWGSEGKCYVFTPGDEASRKEAKRRAYIQGAAAEAHGADSKMLIEKELTLESLPPLSAETALAAIAKMALDPVEASDVYIGRGRVANTQLDRSYERFPVGYLQRFEATLPGRPVLSGHDKASVPIGRWFAAKVVADADGTHHLEADFYLDAQSEVARRVGMGIAKELSIGLIAAGRDCDLCGGPYLSEGCQHQVGRSYDGQQCTLTYSGDLAQVEAIEASFVGVPCQYGAQTIGTKSFLPGSGVLIDTVQAGALIYTATETVEERMEKAELEARVKVLEDENTALKKDVEASAASKALIDAGQAYHADLKAEIVKNLGILEEDAAIVDKLLANADLETLKQYNTGLLDRVDKQLGPAPRSRALGNGAGGAPPPEPVPPTGGRENPFFAQVRSS